MQLKKQTLCEHTLKIITAKLQPLAVLRLALSFECDYHMQRGAYDSQKYQ